MSVVVLGGRCCRRCFDSLFRCRFQEPVWPLLLLFQGREGLVVLLPIPTTLFLLAVVSATRSAESGSIFLRFFFENFAGSLFVAFLCDLLDRSLSLRFRSFLFCLLVNWREKERKEKECSFCFCHCVVVFPFPSLFRQRMVVAHGPVDFR